MMTLAMGIASSMTLTVVLLMTSAMIDIAQSKSAIASSTSTLYEAHPCRFLPATRCFAQNFEFTTKTVDFAFAGVGEVLNDDESHAKKSMWKIRGNRLILEGGNTGEIAQCHSTGTMALLKPSSPFFTDNVHAEFDILVDTPAQGEAVGVGYVFRYRSFVDFYRFEWQNDCMSVVHYVGAKKKRVANVLARADAIITFDRWYHVTVDMNAGAVNVVVRSVRLRGANSVPENAEWQDENYSLSVTNDTSYTPLLSFIGGFYGVGTTSMRVDNVIMVALDQRDYLGSWDDMPYPNNTVCATLPDTVCFFENFEHKYLDEVPHAKYVDGPVYEPGTVKWSLIREPLETWGGENNRHYLSEDTGYGVSVESGASRSPCQRHYGTYFTLNDTDKIQAEELIISFMMKAGDKHTRGIGIMLRVQNSIPGFRPTPSYYRYSWGEAATGDVCDSLLYHNGLRGRFEDVMSESADIAAPEALRVNTWHRIEVHVSRDRIEVTRDGELVGQPIIKPNGAPSLRLTWGGIALFCGGREGATAPKVCAFDDLLVVGKEYARQAVVWDTKSVVPEERPVSTEPLIVTAPLALTRWEGMRVWSMYYTRGLEGVCVRGETFKQPVSIEFMANGHFHVYAHEVKLPPAKDGSERYLLSENRDGYLVEDYDLTKSKLYYKHFDSDSVHCMTFKLNDDQQFAFMSWSKEDKECEASTVRCGFTAEMSILGESSEQYPPSIVVTDPLPGKNEQWTVGENQTVTLRVYNAHNLKAQVFVQLVSKEVESTVKLNRLTEFSHEATDQWITGEAKLTSVIDVDGFFSLGRNAVVFELKHSKGTLPASVDIEVVCPVCMNGTIGREASTCAYWCSEKAGCVEPKCELGKIKCTKRFTGHDIDGYCTKWTKDRPQVCRPSGGCVRLDDYNFCDWAGNEKKPVATVRCASPACRKNCEPGTEAPGWSFYQTNNLSLVCETEKTTGMCTGNKARCRWDGSCRSEDPPMETAPHFAPGQTPTNSPTPAPPPPPVPLEEPVTPVCRQCVNDFGEPGSPQWCVCCKYDCNKAKSNYCTNVNGFCRSRCIDSEGTFCPVVAPPPTPQAVFETIGTRPPVPGDQQHHAAESAPPAHVDNSASDDSDETDNVLVAHQSEKTDESDPDSDTSSDSEESSESDKKNKHKASVTPSPTTTTKATTTEQLTAPRIATTTVEHLLDTAAPAHELLRPNSVLGVGVVLFVALVVVVVLYRKRTQQKPIDLAHVA